MDIKIYLKRGNLKYQEKNMIRDITPILEAKFKENPSLKETFRPATNYEELQKMYYDLTAETVEPVESTTPEPESTPKSEPMSTNQTPEDNYNKNEDYIPEENPDPLNDNEPVLYDYTTSGSGRLEENPVENLGKTNFEEPTSYSEAFEYPSDDEPQPAQSGGFGGGNQGGGGGNFGGGGNRAERPSNDEPRINPQFDDMSNAKKRKSTKKFAKYIVETICMLSEKGFVWFATKDINDAKLTEYELTGEIDLSLLLTMDNGQQATVKSFFQMQALKAEQLAVIDDESKQDLIDSLFEVLMEKGIAPTPAQELMLVAGKILVGQAINLFALSAQTNSVLNQLRMMKKAENEIDEQEYQEQSANYFDNQPPQNQTSTAQTTAQTPAPSPEPTPTVADILLSDSTELATTRE